MEYTLKVKLVKSIDFNKDDPSNDKMQMLFLNNLLSSSLRKLCFVEIGKTKKFFNSKKAKKSSQYDVSFVPGYSANFLKT